MNFRPANVETKMATERIPPMLLFASIPVALLALAQLMHEDSDDIWRVLHGHRIVLPRPVPLWQGFLALLVWSVPTVLVLAVVARRKLWRSKLAIGAVACWALFTAYSWASILVLVFYSR